MNILFLTFYNIQSPNEYNLYSDLMREFKKNGNRIFVVSPYAETYKDSAIEIEEDNYTLLKIQIGNGQVKSFLKKGMTLLLLEYKLKEILKQYFREIKFDLVIYSTPPITFHRGIRYIKKRDSATTYLLLKDIFPQNAVDLGIINRSGWMKPIYHYFRNCEEKIYSISDHIGCMSEANVNYLLANNPSIHSELVEVCPNSIEPRLHRTDHQLVDKIKNKYHIPFNRTIFLYGGNLGKPQGLEFLIHCLEANRDNDQVYFIIAGSGAEAGILKRYFEQARPINACLLERMPHDDYQALLDASDVGLIFLDRRFTIPNFPSRLLAYMDASIPVLAATDVNTDIGDVIVNGDFGFWCESGDIDAFNERVKHLCDPELRKRMGANARRYLEDHYTVKHSYDIIMKHFI